MRPLALSDLQLDTIMRAAGPLPPAQRAAFLHDVAAARNGHELGDGLVALSALNSSDDVSTRRTSAAPVPSASTDKSPKSRRVIQQLRNGFNITPHACRANLPEISSASASICASGVPR